MQKSKVKNLIIPTAVLSLICITVAIVLSVVNLFTYDTIEQGKIDRANEACREVYPASENFDDVDITSLGLPSEIKSVRRASDGGYVFECKVKGYKNGLVVMCGVTPEGKISGTKCIESQETNGAEVTLNGRYDGSDAQSLTPDIITASTKTSEGYHKAVKAALDGFTMLKNS